MTKLAWIRPVTPRSKFSKTRINTDLLRDSTIVLEQRIRDTNPILIAILSYYMAQSALKDSGKSPLGIQPFWEKANLEPPLRWEYWRTQLKLAILAREGMVVDILSADPPEHVVLPPKLAYEDVAENPTAQSERDRRTRNEQAKMAWKNRCQRIEAVGVLHGDKPWKLCDPKSSSLMYLSLETEG